MADFKISTRFLTQFVNLTGNRLKNIGFEQLFCD